MEKTIAYFRAEYAKADALVIEVQSFRNKAGWPAILELRNAGHHFLKAVDDTGKVVNEDHLVAAISHARRACYEATETGIVIALAIVKKFKDDYRRIAVSDVIPDYVPRLRACDEALSLLEAGREDDYPRDGDHQKRIDAFHTVRPFAADLELGREEVNKKADGERRTTRRFVITALLAAITLLLTVAGIIWASTGYRSFWKADPHHASANHT